MRRLMAKIVWIIRDRWSERHSRDPWTGEMSPELKFENEKMKSRRAGGGGGST